MIYTYTMRKGHRCLMTSNTFLPNTSSSQLTLEIDILFKFEGILIRRFRYPPTESVTRAVNRTRSASASMAVGGERASAYEDMVKAVAAAIGGDALLRLREPKLLINLAWREVSRRRCPTRPEYGVLRLGFEIRTVFLKKLEGESIPGAPDPDAALVEEEDVEEATGCCICLEEIRGGGSRGGGAALRMPCLHVFHGGCIGEWLRKSHRCPLCRYEMPTATPTPTPTE